MGAVSLVDRIDAIIGLFNSRSLDLPDGFFARDTELVLNGVAFERLLGREPGDPLVRLLARGAAGYRFAIKALQHAVPDVEAERGRVVVEDVDGRSVARLSCWLSGSYRGTGAAANDLLDLALTLRPAGVVERVAATLDPDALARLREARLRP